MWLEPRRKFYFSSPLNCLKAARFENKPSLVTAGRNINHNHHEGGLAIWVKRLTILLLNYIEFLEMKFSNKIIRLVYSDLQISLNDH